MLATQRAIHGAFICSSAPRTVPIKADNVIIKRADSKNCQPDTLIYQPLLFIKPLKLQCFHPGSVTRMISNAIITELGAVVTKGEVKESRRMTA